MEEQLSNWLNSLFHQVLLDTTSMILAVCLVLVLILIVYAYLTLKAKFIYYPSIFSHGKLAENKGVVGR
jgi:uncharacterized membrane protein YqhA